MKARLDIEKIFQRSIIVMVSVSAWVLAFAEGSAWPGRLTPVVALLSHLLIDRRRLRGLSIPAANALGVAAFVGMAMEFYGGTLLVKLLSGAHLLVYMSWIVLFLRKGIRQYWWLCALSVLQISVASILTNAPAFGGALVLMLFVMVWTLSVFSLYRARLRLGRASQQLEDSLTDQQHSDADESIVVSNGLQMDTDQRWIGLRFVGITGTASVASLIIGVIAFALFPRFFVSQALSGIDSLRGAVAQRTGFTESVELGDIGQIMQSDQRVLQFQITRMDSGDSVRPQRFADQVLADEILFRGNALGHYRDSRWTSGATQGRSVGDLEADHLFNHQESAADFRIRIIQDPPVGNFAFTPTPVANARMLENRGSIEMRRLSYALVHQLKREAYRSEPLTYEVWCRHPSDESRFHVPLADRQRARRHDGYGLYRSYERRRSLDSSYAHEWCITEGLQDRLPRLWELAHKLCRDGDTMAPPRECLQRIERYLTAYGRFRYTLNAAIKNPSLDPVEDFLFNRQSGHCEYFASSGALMLQAVGVPARVVNGYKGCDLNSVTKTWEVKQRHAHAWVEAFIDDHWITFDPTPAAQRDQEVAQTNGPDWWSDLRTAFSDNWYTLVQKMSLKRQEELVRPLVATVKSAWQTIREQGLLTALKIFYNDVILNPQRWISWRGWLLTFILLLGPGLWLQRRPQSRLRELLRRLREWTRTDERRQRTVVRFFETFCQLCRRHGMPLSPTCTASETANHAAETFRARLAQSGDEQLPARIASAFNKVRFGDYSLSEDQVAAVRADVQHFELLLKQKHVAGSADASPASG